MRRTRQGFTLVELLTVIVIISILASLITAAVISVVRRAKEAREAMEIKTLESQLHLFKLTYGDFPPSNLSNPTEVTAFLRRAFPRYNPSQFYTDLAACGVPVSNDPAMAIVFWLGGIPDASGYPSGFSIDPEHPFTQVASSLRTKSLFDFDRGRLDLTTFRYFPSEDARTANAPYIYFKGSEFATSQFTHNESGTTVVVKPFVDSRQMTSLPTYFRSDTFQLISAGRDCQYGGTVGDSSPTYPSMNIDPFRPGQYDNQTNFTDGTLEDALTKSPFH